VVVVLKNDAPRFYLVIHTREPKRSPEKTGLTARWASRVPNPNAVECGGVLEGAAETERLS
jgi:hypothetical protein